MQTQIKTIPELFYLYCTLNYNGYDKENNQQGMHPVRRGIRQKLAQKNLSRYNFNYHPFQYTKQILTTKNLEPTSQTNPDFLEAIAYTRRFSRQAKLDGEWVKVEQETQKETQRYAVFIKAIAKELKKFFNFSPPAEKVVFTVNLLESFYRGFSIILKDTAYIITGPSEKPNLRNLLHELLHLYVGEGKFNNFEKVEKRLKKIPENLKKNYPTAEKVIEESLVRSLVVYLSEQSGVTADRELFRSDLNLQLPQVYLQKLRALSPASLSKGDLKKLGELSWHDSNIKRKAPPA